MAKRIAGTSGIVVVSITLIAAVISIATTHAQQTPAAQTGPAAGAAVPAPTPPCGPRDQLPTNLATNVDPKSRCFELRMYTVDPGSAKPGAGINELHQRFREGELALFKKHGAEILAGC